MVLDEDYKPRFTFEITEEQKRRSDKFLSAYGLRKAVFGPVLDDLLDLIEEHGPMAIGVLMSGKVRPRDILPSMKLVDSIGKVVENGQSR